MKHKTYRRLAPIFLTAPVIATFAINAAANTPDTPQNAVAESYSSTSAELFWDRVEDPDSITAYRVYLDGALLQEVPGPSLFLDGLDPGGSYTFSFTAVDALGNESAQSNSYVFRVGQALSASSGTVASPAPSEPTASAASISSAASALRLEFYSANVAELFWEHASDIAQLHGYRIFLDGQRVGFTEGTSFFFSQIDPGALVEVVAVDPAGNTGVAVQLGGSTSAPSTGTTTPAPSDGNLPRNLSQTGSSSDTISVAWQQPLVAADYGYNVYVNGNYVDTTFSTSYQFSNLDAGESLTVSVASFDGAGNFSALGPAVVATAATASSAPETTPETPAPEVPVVAEVTPPVDVTPVPEEVPVVPQTNTQPDFFGAALEFDDEVPTPGGPPTTPKNLRANLIGNDWVELNWAASRDDGSVASYKVYRGDGVTYTLDGNDRRFTAARSFDTTTLIDCNFTFVRECVDNRTSPQVGSTHTYQVAAIDNNGNQSGRSNTLTVRFHDAQGATIEPYSDPYIDAEDRFQFDTDLSNTANFINQFDLTFQDEFNGREIDPQKWTTRLTFSQEDQNIINGELQYFVDTQSNPDFGYDPFVLTGETLKITGIPTPPELSDAALGQPFLSGSLSSHEIRSGQYDADGNLIADKFGTTYGYVEGRIRVSQISGALSSFFLFRRWEAQHSPEIDILEYLGENPFGDEKAFQTYHYHDTVHGNTLSSPTMAYPRGGSGTLGSILDLNEFHTYGVLWEPNLVIWYVNGREVQRLTGPQISRQSMNIVLYLVTGSEWAPRPSSSGPFPIEMEIDYVRAYKRRPYGG